MNVSSAPALTSVCNCDVVVCNVFSVCIYFSRLVAVQLSDVKSKMKPSNDKTEVIKESRSESFFFSLSLSEMQRTNTVCTSLNELFEREK